MPYAADFSIAYGGFTVGGSTARKITGYTVEEYDYETAAIEFEFVTTAATESAFVTELNDCRNAFRDPRNDLTVTHGAQTRTYNHSTNTGLDTNPRIVKDGDPSDAGFSRHFRVRIEFGLPADNVGTAFRRHSTVDVEYTASRQRIVTVNCTYTANSTDGTTGSFTQYRDNISAYLTTVVDGISAPATWETVGEPSVERNETDKVVHATIVAKEILHNQVTGTLNDDDLVDPQMLIEVEDIAPGDSTAGGIAVGGVGQQVFQGVPAGGFFSNVGTTVTTGTTGGPPGQTGTLARPQTVRITYEVSLDQTRTTNIKAKWTGTIRSFLISEANALSAGAVVLLRETPIYEAYPNRFRAQMEFVIYRSKTFEVRISFKDSTQYGKILKPTTEKDVFSYYEYPGPAVRVAESFETYKQETTETDPNKIVAALVAAPGAGISNLLPQEKWALMSRAPTAVSLTQGRPGAKQTQIAEVEIHTVAQFRNRKAPSVANAGGVTGAALTV